MLPNFGINNIYILQLFTLLFVIATATIRFLLFSERTSRNSRQKKKLVDFASRLFVRQKELHVVVIIIIAQIRHTFDVHTGVRLNVRPMQSQ